MSAAVEYSKLFIPFEEHEINALRWRIHLIKKHKLYPVKKLVELVQKITRDSAVRITDKERSEIVRVALKEDFALDEYDRAVLFVTAGLLKADTMSVKSLYVFDRTTKLICSTSEISVEELFKINPDHFKYTRENLKNYSKHLIKVEVSKIRAKLALQEIAAMFNPDIMIPHLVDFSHQYLSSSLTQKWIRKQKYYARYGEGINKIKARKNLRCLAKSICGDYRSIKKRKLRYWQLSLMYEDLSASIKGFRQSKVRGELNHESFEVYCEHHKINDVYSNLILNSKDSPKELALSIMIENKKIRSAKSFREIQPYISKLQKKHFGGNILSIAADMIPVIVDFLDLPTQYPEIVEQTDIVDVLEKVRLT